MRYAIGVALLALAGCGQPEPLPTGPLFCDIEEPRRFSQEEWDWRSDNAPWNLRRDVKTNAAWDDECRDL